MIKPRIYLSGAIEFTTDAYSWRNTMFRELHDTYEVVIPDLIPCPFTKDDDEYGAWVKKNFILPDMKDVATCHKFFVYIDHTYSSGTYGELSLAAWLNKDIVCFLDKGIKVNELPMWILGCLSDCTFVNSINDAIIYYKKENVT